MTKASQAWRDTQTATRGWSYGPKGNRAYGSMTAGGVAALVILDVLQEQDWKQDAAVTGYAVAGEVGVILSGGLHLSVTGAHYGRADSAAPEFRRTTAGLRVAWELKQQLARRHPWLAERIEATPPWLEDSRKRWGGSSSVG